MNQKGFANIVLIILVVVLAGTVGYFALTGSGSELFQLITAPSFETQVPTPQTTTPMPDETTNWKVLRSNYGYAIKYPPILEPINHCGGVGVSVPPLEKCYNISINGNFFEDEHDNPSAESIVIRVLDTRGDNFDSFINRVIVTNYDSLAPKNRNEFLLTKLSGQILSKKIDGKDTREFSFTGVLQTIPPYSGYSGGFEGYKGKTKGLLVSLTNSQVLLITYPLEFCKGVEAPYQCFLDDRISLYQSILSTLSF